jgi:hypothetical protein
MNNRTTYEITIAEKLGQLQVPDLREAIWSRIEDQLDMDINGDDTPGDPPTSPKPFNWISITKRFGTFSAIVAIITIIFINQKQSTPATQQNNSPAPVQNNIPQNNSNAESPPGEKQINPQSNNSITIDPSPNNLSDSFINTPLISTPVITDTIQPQIVSPPVTRLAEPVKQDTVPKKKPRGFKGITDDDYRISLKKDSVP